MSHLERGSLFERGGLIDYLRYLAKNFQFLKQNGKGDDVSHQFASEIESSWPSTVNPLLSPPSLISPPFSEEES